MRANGTLTVSAASDFAVEQGSGVMVACTAVGMDQQSPRVLSVNFNVASGLTAAPGSQAIANNTTNARLNISAEL